MAMMMFPLSIGVASLWLLGVESPLRTALFIGAALTPVFGTVFSLWLVVKILLNEASLLVRQILLTLVVSVACWFSLLWFLKNLSTYFE